VGIPHIAGIASGRQRSKYCPVKHASTARSTKKQRQRKSSAES
jgi:hypothetical protein